MSTADWDYQVRFRAYELWNEAGRPNGRHLIYWEAAERELTRSRDAVPSIGSSTPSIFQPSEAAVVLSGAALASAL